MPRFGDAHKLLSSRHSDTSPPAAGADPDDGQIATWSAALGAWIAADAPEGVTDHGLLSGLYPDDDHAQYALLSGRSGGQVLKGGLAASEHLTLRSTDHATRGYVRAQDDLQLLSNILRGSDGVTRLELAATSPHIALTGDLDVSGHGAFGGDASPVATDILSVQGTIESGLRAYGINLAITSEYATGVAAVYGVTGSAKVEGTPTISAVAGLYFLASHRSSSPCFQLLGCVAFVNSTAAGSGAITSSAAFFAPAASWGGAKPATTYGVDILEQGGAGVVSAYGLRIKTQTGTSSYLLYLEGAGAAPYLVLLGGATLPANQTPLYLVEESTLRQVQWVDPGNAGVNLTAGQRVMILV